MTSDLSAYTHREIPLTQGKVALVDAADYEWLMQWKWRAAKNPYTWYAVRSVRLPGGSNGTVLMHRVILNAPSEKLGDHKDGNGLRNTRDNLRLCTKQENMFNQAKTRGASQYKGVSYDKRRRKWIAKITHNRVQMHLGTFADESKAARAYDAAAEKLYGEFARLNFPRESATP